MYTNIEKLFKKEYVEAKLYQAPLFEQDGVRLYMNENELAPSKVFKSVLNEINDKDLYQYENGGNLKLITELAKINKVNEENLIVTSGSAAALFQIFISILDNKSSILLPNPGWSYYNGISSLMGAKCLKYSFYHDNERYYFDVDNIISMIEKHKPKVLIITSPNMPTGNTISKKDLNRIAEKMEQGVLIVDEAYYGFDLPDYEANEFIQNYNNILFTRTFSKFYGLANARIGYIIGNGELISLLKKSSDLFGISGISQKLAISVLRDDKFYHEMRDKINMIKKNFIKKINRDTSFLAYESKSNFILINTFDVSAKHIVSLLKSNGFLVRDCVTYDLYNHIRISVGSEKHMEEIYDILKSIS